MFSQQFELIVRSGGQEVLRHRFPPGEYIIGRAPGCAVELPLSGVSAQHARLVVTKDSAFIEDLGSPMGTSVGNRRINGRTQVAPGTRFQIGVAVLEWRSVGPDPAKGTPATTPKPAAKIAHVPRHSRPAASAPQSPSRIVIVRDRSSLAVALALLAIVGVGGYFIVKSLKREDTGPSKQADAAAPDSAAKATTLPIAEIMPAPAQVVKTEPPAPAPEPPKPAPPPMPAPVPEAKPAAPIAAKPADDYPGVPVLNLSPTIPSGDPDFQRLLAAARWAGANGKWDRLHTDLTNALVTLAGSGGSVARPANIEKMIEARIPAAAFAQERFIRAIGEGVLKTFTADRAHATFIDWLFARPAILAAFGETIQPQDKPREALQAWFEIWTSDEEGREQFANLAIACALVFDKPVRFNPAIFGVNTSQSESPGLEKEASAVRHYRFFRDSAKRGALRAPITEMTPGDLVWVVDAPVPESELLWAQKNMNLSRQSWGKAYGMIRYRMDRATQGVNPYKAYTLAEILKEGGICGDQAYFAAITAKANGIPAMVIGGEGDRGGHAWFGYKVSRNTWDLTTGRYADNYAAGETSHPQTQQKLKEHELKLYADPARRTDGYARSERLVALAKMFGSAKRNDLAAVAIDDALKLAPKNLDAWFSKMASLQTAKIPVEDWKREVARMRTAFHGYSDVVQEIDRMAADYVAQSGDLDAARKLVRQDAARMGNKDKERTDLILEGVFREADLAEKTGDAEKIGRIYRDAMRDKGGEVVAFKKIAKRYYDWGKNSDKGEATVRDILRTFDQKHKEPTGDVFAIGAYRGALGQIIAMTKEQGMTTQEQSLGRREAKLKTLEEKIGKEQSRNAAR